MKAAGIPVSVGPYNGAHQSIDAIATKIRNGRLDSRLMGWASAAIKAAGSPQDVKSQMQACLNAYAEAAHFRPDPIGAEYVSSAVATLCLAPNLCVGKGDCDDGTVAMGSIAMGFGWPTVVTKQNFGPELQEHVIIEVFDASNDRWLPVDVQPNADGSLLPVGQKRYVGARGFEEQVDPMNYVGSSGTKGPEIVTLGLAPHAVERQLVQRGAYWWEFAGGQWWVYVHGTWVPEPMSGPAAAMSAGDRAMIRSIGFGDGVPRNRAVGMGFSIPNNDLIQEQLDLTYATWSSLKLDMDTCWAGPNAGTCPPGYTMQTGGGGCIAEATSASTGNGDPTGTPVPPLPAGLISEDVYTAFYNDYRPFIEFYSKTNGIGGEIAGPFTGGYFGALSNYDILQQTYAYQNLAYQWQLKVKTAGCTLSAPVVNPQTTQDSGLLADLAKQVKDSGIVGGLKDAAIGAAVVGGVGLALYLAWPLLEGIHARRAAKSR
jgi:hypothetical protein